MRLFTAIALTAIFSALNFSTGWYVACWVIYGADVIGQLILKIAETLGGE